MATFSSESVLINTPAETVYDKLSDLNNLKTMLADAPADQIPEDKRELLDSIVIEGDTVTIPGGLVGAVTLRQTVKRPYSLIELQAENTPAPLTLRLEISSRSAESCEVRVDIDIQVPKIMVPMIKGPLQQMADQFGQMMKSLRV